MYLMEGLQQIPGRDRTFAGTLGDPDFKVELDRFLDKVRAHPQDHKKLLLNARLHPFPLFSKTVSNYPVQTHLLFDLIVFAGGSDEAIRKELSQLADAKLQQEIKAELKLWGRALQTLAKVDKSKLKWSLVQAALLDPKKVDDPNGDVEYVYFKYPGIGSDIAKRFLGSVGQEIFKSNASEAHLVKLGRGLAHHAIDLLQGKDSAFKKEVEKERKKQARKAKQAEEERKRKEQRRRRGRK